MVLIVVPVKKGVCSIVHRTSICTVFADASLEVDGCDSVEIAETLRYGSSFIESGELLNTDCRVFLRWFGPDFPGKTVGTPLSFSAA